MYLDSFQKAAAEQNYPYSAIIAGAGTGKTYTLIARIQYLIQNQGLNPSEILVISYTNETVREFSEKIQDTLGISVTVLTFHKLAIDLLKRASITFAICSDSDLKYFIHEFLCSFCKFSPLLQQNFWKIFFSFPYLHRNSYQKFLASNERMKFENHCVQFIHLWKAKGYHFEQMELQYIHSHGRKKAFLLFISAIYQLYESEKESQALLDFDDLIEMATKYISCIPTLPFRHILVDEFQDSSFIRIQLLYSFISKFHLHFTIVGDDCQSIYRFSGTDSNCFSIMQAYFPNIHFFYLKYTYRNSQELIHIANHFVLKNPGQIAKEIISAKSLSSPIEVLFYSETNKIFKMLEYILATKDENILFLGRNSFDWKYYFSPEEITWIDRQYFTLRKFPKKNFRFLTVHQSKGLEADVVIILHLENSTYGFPCQLHSPFFFQFVETKNRIPYEEERRLFYVALTRTKGKVYLFSPLYAPSVFVKELLHDHKRHIKTLFF